MPDPPRTPEVDDMVEIEIDDPDPAVEVSWTWFEGFGYSSDGEAVR